MSTAATTFSQSFFHGSRADLRPGDMISVGYSSNFASDTQLSWVYFTSTMDAAIWGAELAAVKNQDESMSSSRPAPSSMIRT